MYTLYYINDSLQISTIVVDSLDQDLIIPENLSFIALRKDALFINEPNKCIDFTDMERLSIAGRLDDVNLFKEYPFRLANTKLSPLCKIDSNILVEVVLINELDEEFTINLRDYTNDVVGALLKSINQQDSLITNLPTDKFAFDFEISSYCDFNISIEYLDPSTGSWNNAGFQSGTNTTVNYSQNFDCIAFNNTTHVRLNVSLLASSAPTYHDYRFEINLDNQTGRTGVDAPKLNILSYGSGVGYITESHIFEHCGYPDLTFGAELPAYMNVDLIYRYYDKQGVLFYTSDRVIEKNKRNTIYFDRLPQNNFDKNQVGRVEVDVKFSLYTAPAVFEFRNADPQDFNTYIYFYDASNQFFASANRNDMDANGSYIIPLEYITQYGVTSYKVQSYVPVIKELKTNISSTGSSYDYIENVNNSNVFPFDYEKRAILLTQTVLVELGANQPPPPDPNLVLMQVIKPVTFTGYWGISVSYGSIFDGYLGANDYDSLTIHHSTDGINYTSTAIGWKIIMDEVFLGLTDFKYFYLTIGAETSNIYSMLNM